MARPTVWEDGIHSNKSTKTAVVSHQAGSGYKEKIDAIRIPVRPCHHLIMGTVLYKIIRLYSGNPPSFVVSSHNGDCTKVTRLALFIIS